MSVFIEWHQCSRLNTVSVTRWYTMLCGSQNRKLSEEKNGSLTHVRSSSCPGLWPWFLYCLNIKGAPDYIICHGRFLFRAEAGKTGLYTTMSESASSGSLSIVSCTGSSPVNSEEWEQRSSWISASSKAGRALELYALRQGCSIFHPAAWENLGYHKLL